MQKNSFSSPASASFHILRAAAGAVLGAIGGKNFQFALKLKNFIFEASTMAKTQFKGRRKGLTRYFSFFRQPPILSATLKLEKSPPSWNLFEYFFRLASFCELVPVKLINIFRLLEHQQTSGFSRSRLSSSSSWSSTVSLCVGAGGMAKKKKWKNF